MATTTASQAANGLGPDLISSPEGAAAALTTLAESARFAVSAVLGTEGAISTLAFSRSGNGSRTTMEEFYAVPKPVDLKPQAGPSGAAAKGSEKAGEGAAGGNDEDTKAVLALGQKPKWMRDVSRISSPMLRLHQGEERLLLVQWGRLHTYKNCRVSLASKGKFSGWLISLAANTRHGTEELVCELLR